MFNPSDEHEQFVTLLAYDICSGLQIQELQDIDGCALVLTNTQNETSAAITGKLFNLIIVDLDLGGIGLVSSAKNTSCINYNTPIIALADEADPRQRRNLIASGFDDCLLKPLTADHLGEVIKLWYGNDALTSSFNAIQTLLAKCKNNYGLTLILYKKFFEELPSQISYIEEALKTGQYNLAFDITHKLNGAAKICCLQHIEETATALEKCLLQKRHGQTDGCFLMLQQCISVFISHRQLILDHLLNKQ